MDINGPISIQHQELHLIQNVNFEIVSMSFSKNKNYTNYGVAIGKSNTIDNNNIFSYYILNTTNGGQSWNISQLIYKNTIPEVIFKLKIFFSFSHLLSFLYFFSRL